MKLNELRRDLKRSHVEAKPAKDEWCVSCCVCKAKITKKNSGDSRCIDIFTDRWLCPVCVDEDLCEWHSGCSEEAVFESNGVKLCTKHELEARLKECPTCNGTGSIDLSNGTTHACPGCDGEGETAP